MRIRSRVFVASSSEALQLAKAIQQNLSEMDVTVWDQDAFRVGSTIIDELSRNLQQSDFGIFVFSPDDISVIRGRKKPAVRDNVVLELGMFIGRLGRERSFIVRPKGQDMRLPTDLLGIVPAKYDREWAAREPSPALGSACTEIANAIAAQTRRREKELNLAITAALETVCRAVAAPLTPEQAGLRAFIFRKESDELVCRYFWDPLEAAEEVGITRFKIDKKNASEVSVVDCYMAGALRSTKGVEIVKGTAVSPLSNKIDLTGDIKSTIKYILAAPIRNNDDKIWGVVDFDTSDTQGRHILETRTSNAVLLRLANHLSTLLAS